MLFSPQQKTIQKLLDKPYQFGFKSDIESEAIPRGLSEDTVRLISAKKGEPDWMLEFRLKAYRRWLGMKEPTWSDNHYTPIDYNNIVYYSEPKVRCRPIVDSISQQTLEAYLHHSNYNIRRYLSLFVLDLLVGPTSFAATLWVDLSIFKEVDLCVHVYVLRSKSALKEGMVMITCEILFLNRLK